MLSQLQLGLNPLWIIPFAIIALGFSLFLYFRFRSIWDDKWNRTLSVFRFLGVFAILFLLLSPVLKSINNQIQKPKVHVILDNSSSVGVVKNEKFSLLNKQLNSLQKDLKGNITIDFYDLEKEITNLDSIVFDVKSTNINKLLNDLNSQNAGENHVATVLISDGIVNQGLGLSNIVSKKPVYTIGIGDTTVKKDISISELYVNKNTYKGNEFPLQTSVLAKGFKDETAKFQFKVNDKVIQEKNLTFTSNNDLIDLNFNYTSSKAGYLKVACTIQVLKDEITANNNQKSTFVQVKEDRKKIAIVTASPHPDVKAIRSSLDKLDKYKIEVVNLTFGQKLPSVTEFDAFVLHQIPCISCGHKNYVQKIFDSKKPRWIITGKQTSYKKFNSLNNTVSIASIKGEDQVSGVLSKSFDLFQTETFDFEFLRHAPPFDVPFASYAPKPQANVLFQQMVGSIDNGKPLFLYRNFEGNKEFVTIGDGLWKWKMFENLENNNSKNFDLLITKIIGLLDNDTNGSDFEVNAQKDNYLISEKPSLSVVVKNKLGELVYNNPVNIKVTRNDTIILSTSFKVSSSDPFYKIPALPAGIYHFVASATVSGKKVRDYGAFTVSDLQLESKNLQADFDALRGLAINSGGKFYKQESFNSTDLATKLKAYPNKIISYEYERLFNDLFWPLLLILLLFSVEWVSRKLLGDV